MGKSSSHAAQLTSTSLPVITVDGVNIDQSELASELQYHQNPEFENVVQLAGQALVIKQLLLSKAISEGVEIVNGHEEETIQKLITEKVSYSDPTEQDCLRYFDNNRSKFVTEPLMEVDHILLAAAKDDFAVRDVAKHSANEIITQLQQQPKDFAKLAIEYSDCPSKKTGGSLGQLSKGSTVPEFEKQLKLLPEGLAEKVIESRYGVHIVYVRRKIEGKALDYPMVADRVKAYLTHRASHLAIQAFIQSLIEKAKITGIKMKFVEENIHI